MSSMSGHLERVGAMRFGGWMTFHSEINRAAFEQTVYSEFHAADSALL